jgi:hypothetical protein
LLVEWESINSSIHRVLATKTTQEA